MPITLTLAAAVDAQSLADLYIGHITAHPENLSHGEIQMGEGFVRDGGVANALLRNAIAWFHEEKRWFIQYKLF